MIDRRQWSKEPDGFSRREDKPGSDYYYDDSTGYEIYRDDPNEDDEEGDELDEE